MTDIKVDDIKCDTEQYWLARIMLTTDGKSLSPDEESGQKKQVEEFNKEVDEKLEDGYKVYGNLEYDITTGIITLELIKSHKKSDKIKNYTKYQLILESFRDAFCDKINEFLSLGYSRVFDKLMMIRQSPFDTLYLHVLCK